MIPIFSVNYSIQKVCCWYTFTSGHIDNFCIIVSILILRLFYLLSVGMAGMNPMMPMQMGMMTPVTNQVGGMVSSEAL